MAMHNSSAKNGMAHGQPIAAPSIVSDADAAAAGSTESKSPVVSQAGTCRYIAFCRINNPEPPLPCRGETVPCHVATPLTCLKRCTDGLPSGWRGRGRCFFKRWTTAAVAMLLLASRGHVVNPPINHVPVQAAVAHASQM